MFLHTYSVTLNVKGNNYSQNTINYVCYSINNIKIIELFSLWLSTLHFKLNRITLLCIYTHQDFHLTFFFFNFFFLLTTNNKKSFRALKKH
jgi:hypothetical protein